MSLLAQIGSSAIAAVGAARNLWTASHGAATLNTGSWTRQSYYGILWAFYRNTVYQKSQTIADPFLSTAKYLQSLNLYPRTKGIYNPTARLVDFYTDHIMGGPLDLDAGDGTLTRTAIPILSTPTTRQERRIQAIRGGISRVWKWSNWDVHKATYTRYGAALGNSAIRVIDDPLRQQIRFEVVYPGEVVDLQLDGRGNVVYWHQQYTYEEMDQDSGQTTTHTFEIKITKEAFATFRDGQPFAYPGTLGQQWSNPYGFVPVVWVKHKDTGTDLGLCAYHHAIPKINDLNEIASHLGEQLRKTVHPEWLITGATEPKSGRVESGGKVWTTMNEHARPWPLNDQVDINGVVAELHSRIEELEKDFPELTFHKVRERMGNGDLPGKAVRIIMQDAVAKLEEARVPYHSGLIRAHKMALSMGGLWGFPGFENFDVQESYEEGMLDHTIGFTDIVPPDEMELLLLATNTATVANLFADLEAKTGRSTGELMTILREVGAMTQAQALEEKSLRIMSESAVAEQKAAQQAAQQPAADDDEEVDEEE